MSGAALAPTIVGGAIGAGSILGANALAWWIGSRSARAQRDHEHDLALAHRRSEVYMALLEVVLRLELYMKLRNPIITPAPTPPEPPSLDRQLHLSAEVQAFASADVARLYIDFMAALQSFDAESNYFDELMASKRRGQDRNEDAGATRRELDDRRAKASAICDEIARRVAAELQRTAVRPAATRS